MNHAVIKLRELGIVPSVGCAHEIPGDSLQTVNVGATTFRADRKFSRCVLISAVHTPVAIMVNRAVTDIVAVHEVNNVSNSLRIMGSVAVNLNLENMAATGQLMIGSLDFRFVAGRAVVVDGHMVGVSVVDFVSDAGENTEGRTVTRSKLP